MIRYVDLSHDFEDGMPGFRLTRADGSAIDFTARIRPVMPRAETAAHYGGECAFEFTEILFQTSIGTYLDSPYARYEDGADVASLPLDRLIAPGLVIDARGLAPGEIWGADRLPPAERLAGRAVLFNFGWDRLWGQPGYANHPVFSLEVIDALIDARAALVGVDTPNVDDVRIPSRPAHTRLLAERILIVENLACLDALYGLDFRFHAIPLKACRVGTLPVRAYAEALGSAD